MFSFCMSNFFRGYRNGAPKSKVYPSGSSTSHLALASVQVECPLIFIIAPSRTTPLYAMVAEAR